MSLYLILPACLCQLLAAFGFGVHGDLVAADHRPVSELAAAVTYVTLDCHCDDHVTKTAMAGASEAIGVDHFDLICSSVEVPSLKAADRDRRVGLYPRGPPLARPVWSLASYSGVYRI